MTERKTGKVITIHQDGSPMTPMEMLRVAIHQGAAAEVMEKLLSLQERWEKNQARKAFDTAIALAKEKLPIIKKNKRVNFTSPRGTTDYRYEDLAGIARQIDPILSANGLSYRYRTEADANSVKVTCIISHRDGHSEENSLAAIHDHTGNKNDIQAVGSTVTYLQRYTLKAALGLAASTDDDGRTSESVDKISAEQLKEINEKCDIAGCNKQRLADHLQVGALAELPQARFEDAINAILAYAAAKAKRDAATKKAKNEKPPMKDVLI